MIKVEIIVMKDVTKRHQKQLKGVTVITMNHERANNI